MEQRIGADLAGKMRDISIRLYQAAADYAATRGIIIADTKFEFGLDDNGVLHLMDEVLTADSSRFWPADSYRPGMSPPSFDKQFVRDYLETLTDWNKTPPAPPLPADVIEKTRRQVPRGAAAPDRRKAEGLREPRMNADVQAAAPLVGVVMGSSSDWEVMQHAVAMLKEFGVPLRGAGGFRAPHAGRDVRLCREPPARRGLRAIIAGAGGAAHLPGMIAAKTIVPVLGVPVPSKYLRGEDSLLSIVQMPKGVPVATFAIGEAGAANAALTAIAILAAGDDALADEAASVPRAPDPGGART